MAPDQSIEIQLAATTGEPLCLADVVVEVHFFTNGQYRYAFKVGRTDQAGHLRVSYREIESIRRRNALENLMDYNTKLDDCDPIVKIVVPSEAHLRNQYDSALRGYQQPPVWAESWPANAKVAPTETPARLVEQVTRVRVPSVVQGL